MSAIHVYSRRGCHLCEVLIEELLEANRDRLVVEIRDIDTREDWREQYDTRVPVVKYDGDLICQYHLDRDALAKILGSDPK
jgi:hypothetical protein